MSARPRLPEDTRFSCQSCGRCCTKWAVPVSQERLDALRKHDWGGEPFEANSGPGDPFRTRLLDGRCFFLDDQNQCRIHSELSYDAKPDACKAFPLKFTEVNGIPYARLSFYCPTVTENKGKRIEQQSKWIQQVHRASGDITRTNQLELCDEVPLSTKGLDGIERRLLSFVDDDSATMADRLAACAGLLRRLIDDVEGKDPKDAPKVLERALLRHQDADLDTLAAEGRSGAKASQAGPLFSLFLGQDTPDHKLSRVGHFFGVRFFHLGLARLKSAAMQAKASSGQIKRIAFDPPLPDDALLPRYFRDKLKTRRYLADDNSVLSGFNILAAAYGMISLLSRLKAASEGRDAIQQSDLLEAVQAADLLVVEHPSLYHAELSSFLLSSILENPQLCGAILARVANQP